MVDSDDSLSTLQQSVFDPSEAPTVAFRIDVVSGVDAGSSFDVVGSERVFVGTSPAAKLRLSDRTVSRRHLTLEIRGGDLAIEDVGSRNGTMLGGTRIRSIFVRDPVELVLGDTTLRIAPIPRSNEETLPLAQSFAKVVGASREMRRLYPLLRKLADSDIPAIIEGETGTGKEVVAECLHEESARRNAPFVVFDCTAVPPSLAEVELFGHERGAFTGAVGQRRGVFEQAHGGTLFIDEIGDLDPVIQPKLLRAIERSEVRRVGGDKWLKVDVRIICATRRNLDAEVEAGRFRDDLFHRLAVGRVELPPLRERRGDIPLLIDVFRKQLGAPANVSPDVVARWERHEWPGNVRELRNAVARYVALGAEAPRGSPSRPAPAQDAFASILALGLPLPTARARVVDAFERVYIERILAEHGGNVSRAALAAGVARRYFQLIKARTKSADDDPG